MKIRMVSKRLGAMLTRTDFGKYKNRYSRPWINWALRGVFPQSSKQYGQ